MNKLFGLIACLVLFAGCASIHPKFRVNIDDRVDEYEASAIVDGINVGFRALLGCPYLQVTRTDAYAKLLALQDTLVIKYMTDDILRGGGAGMCAAAFLNGKVIYIAPDILDNDGCNPTRDIPHEMLHLIGFSHDNSEDDCKEFYRVFNECVDKVFGVDIEGLPIKTPRAGKLNFPTR